MIIVAKNADVTPLCELAAGVEGNCLVAPHFDELRAVIWLFVVMVWALFHHVHLVVRTP